MHDKISKFAEENEIIPPSQYGFRKGHSTDHAITHFICKVKDFLDTGFYASALFIDLSKAFDTVNHNLLVRKLKNYKFPPWIVSWIESYLSDRSQVVIVGPKRSREHLITCGIPQGSILGPLLYLIYTADIGNFMKDCLTISFADDTVLLFRALSVETLFKTMESALNDLIKYTRSNRLLINIKKTNYMIFSTIKKVNTELSLTADGYLIYRVSKFKYLGVIIDELLSWKEHVNSISIKIARGAGILYRLKNFLPQKVLRTLYFTLVYPYMHYSCYVWANSFCYNLKRIQILQNRAVKSIYFNNLNTKEVFLKSQLLTVRQICQLQTAVFMYKYLNNLAPPGLTQLVLFHLSSYYHAYPTSSSTHFSLISDICHTQRAAFSIKYVGVKLWNSIPLEIKDSVSVPSFKYNYKKHLLSTSTNK